MGDRFKSGDPDDAPFKDRAFSRGRGCWNCLDGESLILTPTGPIRLAKAASITQAASIKGEFSAVNAWTPSGKQPVLQIVTTHGARLRLTHDHKVMTDRGWVAAVDLRGAKASRYGGDEVCPLPEVSLGSADDRREAELIGTIIGDGWTNPHRGVGFGCRGDMAEDWMPVIRYAGDRFNSKESLHIKDHSTGFRQIEWRNAAARRFATGFEKHRVPAMIWRSTPNAIGAFLRGLFSTDGNLSVGPKPCISFYQASKSLVEEVQLLLRLIGITSQLSVEIRQPRYKDLYRLDIARKRSLDRFADVVGFVDRRRTDTLDLILHTLRDRGGPERIKSVTPAGYADVYDISVPATQSFHANGMLVHNCASWNNDHVARQHWGACRQRDLALMAQRALLHRDGEAAEEIVQARRMLDMADHAVARGEFGLCLKDRAGADMVHNAYLCDSWSGRAGSSLAIEGHEVDLLPEELAERLDGTQPADETAKKGRVT
jgi:hypothetical protein